MSNLPHQIVWVDLNLGVFAPVVNFYADGTTIFSLTGVSRKRVELEDLNIFRFGILGCTQMFPRGVLCWEENSFVETNPVFPTSSAYPMPPVLDFALPPTSSVVKRIVVLLVIIFAICCI